MASIKKKKIGNKVYYYLTQTIRKGSKFYIRERYLGKELPKDIDKIKKEFLYEIYKEKYFESLEAIQKEFLKQRSLSPKSSREKELGNFMIRFTYNTQRIEGSKLTLKETHNLLEGNITPKSKKLDDIKEAEAHKKVFYDMLGYNKDLSLQVVLYWHKSLFESTKKDITGKIRTHQVTISGSKFIPPFPAEIYTLLREFFTWYDNNKKKLNPVELACLVHLRFVSIHPFADGNGRISRLMMNFVLEKNNYPMFDIKYENRVGYYNTLERSQISKNDSFFLQWFFRNYIKEYKR